MAIDVQFDLTQFLKNVIEELKARLTDMEVVKSHLTNDLDIGDLEVPAVLVNLYEIQSDAGRASGTGQLPVNLMMTAYVVVDASAESANLKVREYAIDVAAVIHDDAHFDSPVGAAEITGITSMPEIHDENDSYIAWKVKWKHPTLLGIQQSDSLCDDPALDAADIDRVFLGIDPETGEENKNKYKQVAPNV